MPTRSLRHPWQSKRIGRSKGRRQSTKAAFFSPRFESLECRRLLTSAAGLTIEFDYRYDTNGFFDDPDRRELLEFAADHFEERIADTLLSIPDPTGSNTWSARIIRPDTGASWQLEDLVVPKNTLIVFAGGRPLSGNTRGFGGTGFSWSGSSEWGNRVQKRGTDFNAVWGGHITFDTESDTDWHFGRTTSGLTSGETDFYSIAIHELGHVLGLDHLPEGTQSDGREAAMDPTLQGGTRKTFTTRDWDHLEDRGWDVLNVSFDFVNVDAARYLWGAATTNGADREELSFNDVRQGSSDTCSFAATISSVARTNLDLASGIRLKQDLGNDQYLFEVRMFRESGGSYSPVWIEVPFDETLTPGDLQSNNDGEFWTALYLRAYLTFSGDVDGNYRSMSESMRALTGLSNTRLAVNGTVAQANQVKAALENGSPIVAGTRDDGPRILESTYGLIHNHAYTVMGMEVPSGSASDAYVTIRNPWSRDTSIAFFDADGDDEIDLSEYVTSQYGIDGVNDGVIRLPWTVFSQYFTDIVISHSTGPSINEPQPPNQIVQFVPETVGPFTIGTGVPFEFDLHAVDAEGSFVSYILDVDSPGYVQPQTGLYRWEPKANEVGNWVVTVTAEVSPFDSATTSFVVHVVSEVPRIGSLSAQPGTIDRSGSDQLTLTANNVVTDVGSVSFVEFWRDADGNGQFDASKDAWLGRDEFAAGGWAWQGFVGGLDTGNQVFFARPARYSFSDLHLGEAVATTVMVTEAPLVAPEAIPVGNPVATSGLSLATSTVHLAVPHTNGNYRALWQNSAGDTYTRLYNAAGSPLAAAKHLDRVLSISRDIDMAVLDNGQFAVSWVENQKLYGQWFDAAANPLGGKVQLATVTDSGHDGIHVEIAVASNGNAVVSYSKGGYFDEDVYSAAFSVTGGLTRSEWKLNTATVSTQSHPSVAMNESGNGVIAWLDQNDRKILARRISNFGLANSAIFTVFETSAFLNSHEKPATAINAGGTFVVSYSAPDGDRNGVYARYYAADGTPFAVPFRVNAFQGHIQQVWDVAINDQGWSAITWWSVGQDAGDGLSPWEYGAYAQLIGPTGTKVGPEFALHAQTEGDQFPLGIAMDADADLNVLWRDLHESKLYARRFATNMPPALAAGLPLSVEENSPVGTLVGQIAASDQDGDAVSFAVLGDSPFSISSQSGEITVAASAMLDFEQNPILSITLRLTDNGLNPKSSVVTLPVNLVDVNEAPVADDRMFSIAELSPVGTVVGAVPVFDPDHGEVLTFELNEDSPFAIDPRTGVLTVANQIALDFETNSSHQFTVDIIDRRGARDTASIAVQLSDVDESTVNVAPVFEQLPGSVYYIDGDPAALLFNETSVFDLDDTGFAGGWLRAENISFSFDDDRLEFKSDLGIASSGNQIRWNGTLIGTLSKDGVAANPLQVDLNQEATTDALTALLRSIVFRTSSLARPSALRMLRFSVNDGAGTGTMAKVPVSVLNSSDQPIGQFDILGTAGDDIVNLANLDALSNGLMTVGGGPGNDTLRLSGTGQSLDLTSIPDANLQGFETLDMSGDGSHLLTLNVDEVLNLSPTTSTLRVQHDEGDVVDYGNGWTVALPQIVRGRFVHVMTQGDAAVHVANTTAFLNPLRRQDTNRDGAVAPVDVLIIVNRLNSSGSALLPTPVSLDGLTEFFYVDTNGDQSVAPVDVLVVVNYLNNSGGGAEAEFAAIPAVPLVNPAVSLVNHAVPLVNHEARGSSVTSTARRWRQNDQEQPVDQLAVPQAAEYAVRRAAAQEQSRLDDQLPTRRHAGGSPGEEFTAAIDELFAEWEWD